ncbi:MAG: PEP-CTERM sorting domain-containing protein [Sedimentisphaerales bacterium]|nr:PEP-CTERM sorting domain-containing protein [Sedimentisphaerales bacterium]
MHNRRSHVSSIGILALLMAMVLVSGQKAFGNENDGYVLIVKQSPVDTGIVTPDVGVHRQGLNERVSIQAIAKPGYRFVYWLGGVENPTDNRTFINVDAPKIVIAVFEREEFELLSESDCTANGASIGGAIATAYDTIGGTGEIEPSGGALPPRQLRYLPPPPFSDPFPVPGEGDELEDDDFPVPGDDGDEEIEPVPEPTTIALFAAGGLLLRKRRTKVKQLK